MINDNIKHRDFGFISIVGAGPGHPDLITVKGLNAIKKADVILYDALVGDGFQELFPATAKAIYVGKRKDNHSYTQDQINSLIIEHSKNNQRVVRLKGGDPFVFGRGGEELLEIKKYGIEYEVIPGVSAAMGVSSFAEIPLTHRGVSDDLRIITGHKLRNEAKDLAKYKGTLVLYMAVSKAQEYAQLLLKFGASLNRPIALVENAALENQEISISNLEDVALHGFIRKTSGPGLLVIGEVVNVFHSNSEQKKIIDAVEKFSHEINSTHNIALEA